MNILNLHRGEKSISDFILHNAILPAGRFRFNEQPGLAGRACRKLRQKLEHLSVPKGDMVLYHARA